jgi:hypothetical protein
MFGRIRMMNHLCESLQMNTENFSRRSLSCKKIGRQQELKSRHNVKPELLL